MLHLLAEVEPLMRAPFTVLFVAAEMGSDSGKTFDFLRALLHRFRAIHLRVAAFYLVHPTLKMRFTFTILGVALWGKLKFVDELAALHEHFEKGQLRLPAFVFAADERRKAAARVRGPIRRRRRRSHRQRRARSLGRGARAAAVGPTGGGGGGGAGAGVASAVGAADDDDGALGRNVYSRCDTGPLN